MAELNLAYYKGKDDYTDGDVEDKILEYVLSEKDAYTILNQDSSWPILYHFSPDRKNLLEWYPFENKGGLLEIGCGCGALTGLFCSKVNNVVSVELSKKRANITYQRYKSIPNLSVLVGNFMDMKFEGSFHYITLIGVLEYAESFINASNPWQKLLTEIKPLLNEDGWLILAIENKFGLKYFSGASEDHTMHPFDGIEGYTHSERARTFSKPELSNLLKESGFKTIEYYYPYPDYKLPGEIFSDSYLPDVNNIATDAPNFDHERLKLFSERRAFVNIIKNGMFDFFSNSFLVFAGT
jgi:SAM-dependent methyltransferase